LGSPHLLMEREFVVGSATGGVTSASYTVLIRYDTRWNVNALFDTIWSLGQGPWLTRNAYPAAEQLRTLVEGRIHLILLVVTWIRARLS
jgi:hypothetical protein